jgi:hypothetical protein
MTLHLTGPALWFFETLRSLQPARQVNVFVRRRRVRSVEEPEPEFGLGQRVRVVVNDCNRTPHEGTIRAAVWHHKERRFHYYLQEAGRKVSKRYAAEDLQPVGMRMSPATIRQVWPYWSDLDRLLLRELMCWPWESQNSEVHAIWGRLTHPDNLAALEEWAQGVESFNEFAKGCTLRALTECRLRSAEQAEPGRCT